MKSVAGRMRPAVRGLDSSALDLSPFCAFLRIWATHLLHSTLSIARCSALSHDISRPLKSFLTVSVQFFRGLHLLFSPQEPNAIPGWIFYPCPCATCVLATALFSS